MTPYHPNPHTPIDRILVSILQKRLKSITEEMSIAMSRTTRSPILCEAKDFVTGLYDFRGRHAGAEGEPAHPGLQLTTGVQVHHRVLR